MPKLSEPVLGHHEEVVTGIYIARGSETLGPYNSLEAAALVIGGYLRADDYAARNGDGTWVSLANFLPLSSLARGATPTPLPPPIVSHPHRWRQLAVAFVILLTAPLLVAGGVRWFGRQPSPRQAEMPLAPLGSVPSPSFLPVAFVALPLDELAPSEPAGSVHGSLSLLLPGSERFALHGVRVSAYSLAALESALAQVNVEAQAARTRLDPQIDAAAAECATRTAEAKAALQVLRDTSPRDPLIGALRFANQGAKTAAKAAEDDYRYLVEERAAAAGGEVYFRALPAPAAAADTDARGGFILPLPPGDEPFAVAASASQTGEDGKVQLRYWLVQLSPAQRIGRESLALDDGNVTSASSAAESVIHTAE